MKKIICLVLISLLYTQLAYAGAWTIPKHEVYAEFYEKWAWADEDFDSKGDAGGKSNGGRSQTYVMEPKIEFGITDWLNFLTSIEYKDLRYKEYDRYHQIFMFGGKLYDEDWGTFTRHNTGVTAVKFGLKARLIEKPVVVSTQLKYTFSPNYGINHGDDPLYLNQPTLGYGDDTLEGRILIGQVFDIPLFYNDWQLPCYYGLETGYRVRNRHVCNDLPFFLEVGAWPFKYLLVKGEIDGYKSFADSGSISSDYAIWRVGIVYQVLGKGKSGITKKEKGMFNIEGQYGQTFWGKNTSKDQELVLKLSTQF